nr:MAG TPA: hypothetical protein [Caudoviricetes sp.]
MGEPTASPSHNNTYQQATVDNYKNTAITRLQAI